jgi:hypothetical protein
MKYWFEYVRSSYELVLEAEGKTSIFLNQDIESYLVHLMARWFDKNDVPPDTPVALLLMTAMQTKDKKKLAETADICLFYDGFQIKQRRWPSNNYYKDMGMMAYGMAYLASQDQVYQKLEENFSICSRVLNNIKPSTIV